MLNTRENSLVVISLVGEDGSFTFPRPMDPSRDRNRGVRVHGRIRKIKRVHGPKTVELEGFPQHTGRPLL